MKSCQRDECRKRRHITRRSFLVISAAGTGAALLTSQLRTAQAAVRVSTLPHPSELTQLSAKRLARMIRKKRVKVEDVIEAHIERIDKVNPIINAVVHEAFDEARLQAHRADKAIDKGEVNWKRQPLFGVPITVKGNIDVQGMPTTVGVPSSDSRTAKKNAAAVQRLLEAGAVILGKTNLPVLASYFETDNPRHGQTKHPYDNTRTPGGSSGGEAAAIAACASPLGLGGDTGGSIRVPAHFCGIAGLRPAWGRVPLGGHHPAPGPVGPLHATAGPMARHVEDLALALPVISGPDPSDPYSIPVRLRNPKKVEVGRLKVAFWEDLKSTTPTRETVRAVQNAARVLAEAGAKVARKQPAHLDKVCSIVHAIAHDYFIQVVGKKIHDLGVEDPLTEQSVAVYSKYLEQTPADAMERAKSDWPPMFQTSMLAFLERYDVMLCPVCATPAMALNTTMKSLETLNGFVYTWAISLVPGVPAGSIRCDTSPEGLPIGVQVVAKPYREDIVLAVMAHLEREFGGWQPPPV